ncbi:MAG: hypothetical protein QM766_22340 [Burkholderiaceae bacterium]
MLSLWILLIPCPPGNIGLPSTCRIDASVALLRQIGGQFLVADLAREEVQQFAIVTLKHGSTIAPTGSGKRNIPSADGVQTRRRLILRAVRWESVSLSPISESPRT